jgi:D-arabinose 5-phosphate isomerase GutQ
MRPASLHRGGLGLLAQACLPLALMSCTLDWTVGPADASETDGPSVSEPDVSASDSGACTTLAKFIAIYRAELLTCQMTCAETVTDQCGCAVPVQNAESQAAKSFVMTVAQYKADGCEDPSSCACSTPAQICLYGVCQ